MGGHRGDADVQKEDCWALGYFALHDDNRAKIAAAGGIEAVVWAMGGHRGDAGVQQWGCGALFNLAFNNADNRAKIAATGGIEAVVGAMGAHRGDVDVQGQGCGALYSLGTGPGARREVQQRIKRANAEEAVTRAMAAAGATCGEVWRPGT